MKEEAKKMVTPFSNGTEAMIWVDQNCDKCVKSFKPGEGKPPPDFSATKKLVNLGRECKMKFAIDIGFITSEVPEDMAALVGHTEEKGWPAQCMMYSDDENDGWHPTPRKPKDAPNCQLCMPFAINDIVMSEEFISA